MAPPVGRLALWVGIAAAVGLPWGETTAQSRVLDEGTLLVFEGSRIVGREEYVLTRKRPAEGFTLTAHAYYPPSASSPQLSAMIEFTADSQPAEARYEFQDGDRQRVFLSFRTRRIMVRVGTARGESAREYPGGGRYLLVHDSLFAHYSLLPGLAAGVVRLVIPHVGPRESIHLTDHGEARTSVDGDERLLHHVSLRSRDTTWHCWYDDRGRLIRVERGDVVAVRARNPGR